MSKEKPKPFLSKSVILFLIGIVVIGSIVYVVLIIYFPVEEPEQEQKSLPVVVIIDDAIEPIQFHIANFDRCVDLLIDFVRLNGLIDETGNSSDKMKLSVVSSQYYDLGCSLVENQLSQTDKYKHRNDVGQ